MKRLADFMKFGAFLLFFSMMVSVSVIEYKLLCEKLKNNESIEIDKENQCISKGGVYYNPYRSNPICVKEIK